MESSIAYLQSLLLDDSIVQLYDPISHQYTSAIMACVMNSDNLNVSNSNIPTVIKEVLKLARKTPDRLPSRSSVDNFVKAKGVIAHKQVVDMLTDKEGTALHSDETRKFGKTDNVYVVTEDTKQPFMLREMSNKSAQKCLDTFKEILNDISDDANNESAGGKLLTNIKNTMSDRAQPEVAFSWMQEQYRLEMLPQVNKQWN